MDKQVSQLWEGSEGILFTHCCIQNPPLLVCCCSTLLVLVSAWCPSGPVGSPTDYHPHPGTKGECQIQWGNPIQNGWRLCSSSMWVGDALHGGCQCPWEYLATLHAIGRGMVGVVEIALQQAQWQASVGVQCFRRMHLWWSQLWEWVSQCDAWLQWSGRLHLQGSFDWTIVQAVEVLKLIDIGVDCLLALQVVVVLKAHEGMGGLIFWTDNFDKSFLEVMPHCIAHHTNPKNRTGWHVKWTGCESRNGGSWMLTQNGKEVNHMTVDYCIINHGKSWAIM